MIHRFAFIVALVAFTAPLLADNSSQQKKGPLRIYILSGQSNMLGKAKIAHLDELVKDPKIKATYEHIRSGGKWVEREDVWVNFFDRKGNLNGMYGDWNAGVHFGPELGFGHAVGAKIDEQVLIIKVAWGGRDLARNFRPPSRGLVENPGAADLCYGSVVWWTNKVLKELPQRFPDYDAARGYEICGFVWFQGWNDVINPGKIAEYEQNLVALAEDLRKDFGTPNMPFIVGELGQDGPNAAGKSARFRTAQKNAVEKVGHAAYVPTGIYIRTDGKKFDGGYHYFGRADTLIDIGNAMGEAAVKLGPDKATDRSAEIRKAYEAFEKSPAFKQLTDRG